MRLKNIVFSIILLMLLMPIVVSAKGSCTIVSGNGKDIGSEIACGTEHFYVIDSSDDEIKMLAKYNLLVGDKISYFDVNDNFLFTNNDEVRNHCMSLATEKGYSPYSVYQIDEETETNGVFLLTGCRVYEVLNPEHIRQDEKAKGTIIKDGKSVLPIYGIVYMVPTWGNDPVTNNVNAYNQFDENGDLIISTTKFGQYLDGYKQELGNQNIEVKDVSFITLSKTMKLLKDISGRDITLDFEYPNEDPVNYNGIYYGKMDIKDYVSTDYKWIYDVTYWLGSGFLGDTSVGEDVTNDYFISNEGMLCAIGRGECVYFPYPVGNGIRPLVTISASNIGTTTNNKKFLIRVKTNNNGTIEVVGSAEGGNTITFKANSKKGYKLDSISITTDSGETVDFKEGEIKNNNDGTMSIDKNSFTMPFEDITIEAKWKLDVENPSTGVNSYIFEIGILMMVGTGLFIILKRKKTYLLK